VSVLKGRRVTLRPLPEVEPRLLFKLDIRKLAMMVICRGEGIIVLCAVMEVDFDQAAMVAVRYRR